MIVTRGGVRLRNWLRDERRVQKWLADQIGTHQTNVSRWILGHVPPLEMAIAIRRVTGISVEAWAEPAEARSRADDVVHRKAG